MKLCVLMPAYNESRYIRSALRSALAARETLDLEIVVVDDGSDDGTDAIVRDMARDFPQIRLIRTQNRGVAHARNTLLAAIPPDADLVTFLDGDDAFAPGHPEKACAIMAANPALDVYYGQLCQIPSDRQDLSREPRQDSLISRTISMSIGIYRPALLEKVGTFDTTYSHAEDMDYLLRLFETAPAVHLSDDIATFYRKHPGNMTSDEAATRRGSARAIMGHIRRRRMNPALASVDGIFKITQLGAELENRRTP